MGFFFPLVGKPLYFLYGCFTSVCCTSTHKPAKGLVFVLHHFFVPSLPMLFLEHEALVLMIESQNEIAAAYTKKSFPNNKKNRLFFEWHFLKKQPAFVYTIILQQPLIFCFFYFKSLLHNRKAKRKYSFGTIFIKHTGAFVDGGACCKNVIYQQYCFLLYFMGIF